MRPADIDELIYRVQELDCDPQLMELLERMLRDQREVFVELLRLKRQIRELDSRL